MVAKDITICLFSNLVITQAIANIKRPYISQEKMDNLPDDLPVRFTNAFFLAIKSSSVQTKVAVIWVFFFMVFL